MIPIPETIVINCNFDVPILIKNKGNSLKFKSYKHGMKVLKRSSPTIFKNSEVDLNKVSCPKVIMKYPCKRKRLVNKLNDIPDCWPDTSQDVVIQRFIRPKGLRATKYRVILKENCSPKVYILTNRDRFDSRNDPVPHHKKISSTKICNDKQILDEIQRTVIDHRQILKILHSGFNPLLKTQSSKKLGDLCQITPGKMKVFDLFKADHGISNKRKISEYKSITLTSRYTTKNEQDRCDVYEGKLQSYTKVIEISNYIQDKINKFALKNSILTEIVLDYLQDHNGN